MGLELVSSRVLTTTRFGFDSRQVHHRQIKPRQVGVFILECSSRVLTPSLYIKMLDCSRKFAELVLRSLALALLIKLVVVVHDQLRIDLADDFEDYTDDDDHSGAGDE